MKSTATGISNAVTEVATIAVPTFNKACMDACAAAKQPKKPFEISKECAECMELNYTGDKMAGLQVMKKQGTRGFNIRVAELRELLKEIDEDNPAELFAMLAIRDTMDGKKEVLMPELVFQVVKETKQNEKLVTSSTYFDFVRSCPTFCPK